MLALGLLVILAGTNVPAETLATPWLGLLSGVVAIGLGAYLLIGRLSAPGRMRVTPRCA